ncbi:MAG: gephyrin-like molybdotransferase Glp [Gemmatimonadota bacterium]
MASPEFEARTPDWLSFEEARSFILARARPLPPETVSLAEAPGRALAQDLRAEVRLPPWDNSAMDGYAVLAEDIARASPENPVALRVTGVVHAGEIPAEEVERGTAVRIMTGAPIPPGADSVVRVEDTDAEETPGRVRIFDARDACGNIRPGGQDMAPGDVVLHRGRLIRPGTIGVLAALGHRRVPVHRRPSVAVISTGNELRGPDRYDDVRAGLGIPESNGPMIAAAVDAAGAVMGMRATIPDDADALRAALEEATRHDVILTIGGASMGEADLVKRVLDTMGYAAGFWRVRMRPGTPFGMGTLPRPDGEPVPGRVHSGADLEAETSRAAPRRVPIFGLPGNPSSAFVTFEVFVRPFLRRLAGQEWIFRRTVRAVAGEDLRGPKARTFFLRVTLSEEGGKDGALRVARLTGPQGSGLVRGLGIADGLARIPEEVPVIRKGEEVEVLLLDAEAPPPTASR